MSTESHIEDNTVTMGVPTIDSEEDDPEFEVNIYNLAFLAFTANLGTFLYGYDYGAVSWTITIIGQYSDDDRASYYGVIDNSDAMKGVLASGCSIGATITYIFLLIYGNEMSKRDELFLTAGLYFTGGMMASTSGTASGLFLSMLGPCPLLTYTRALKHIRFIVVISPELSSGQIEWDNWHGFAILLTGLIIYGAGIACSFHAAPQYVALATPSKYRGAVGAATESLSCTGLGVSYITGFLFDRNGGWTVMFREAYIVAFLMFIMTLYLPHSARFLMENNYPEERVMDSLRFIYPHAGPKLLQQLKDNVELDLKDRKRWERKTHTKLSPNEICHPTTFFNALPSRLRVMLADYGLRLCLILGLTFITFTMLIGPSPMLYYAGSIFETFCPTNTQICILGIGICKVSGAYTMLIIGDLLGRRDFLLIGISLLICGLAVATYGAKTGRDTFALCGIYTFQIGLEVSFGTFAWIFLSELFPRYVRSAATAVVVMDYFIFNSIVTFVFPFIVSAIGLYGAFLIFLCNAVILLNIVYFYGPETRGVDLEHSYKMVKITCNKTNAHCGLDYDDDRDEDTDEDLSSKDSDSIRENSLYYHDHERTEVLSRRKPTTSE